MLRFTFVSWRYTDWRPVHWHALSALAVTSFLWSGAFSAHAAGATEEAIKKSIQSGQLDRAQKLIQKELKADPQAVQWRFMEGVIQAQLGQVDKAIDTFKKITQSHPEQSEAYNNLGVLFAAKGQLEESKAFLEKALQTHPSYAAAHRNLSDVHSHLAKQTYAKALQVDPRVKVSTPQLTLLGSMGSEKMAAAPAVNMASTGGPSAAPAQVNAASQGTPQAAPTNVAPTPALRTATAAAPSVPASPPALPQIPAPVGTTKQTPPAAEVPPTTAANSTASAVVATTAPAEKPASPARSQDSADIEQAVQDWAKAWSEKNMARYFAAYASSFEPANRISRAQWENERRQRIESKQSISVLVSEPKINIEGDKASVRFKQLYNADKLKNNSRKTLDLVRQGKRWLIVRESVS
jgi:tetratricopeptide (TPR) repeat protein